jgi:hypothetical protein
MTPDEHYIRAEQLAAQAAGTYQMIVDASAQKPIEADIRSAWFAEMGVLARLAQVHATLATRAGASPYVPAYQGNAAHYAGDPAAAPYPAQAAPPAGMPPMAG